jgi:hypothetical protein
VLAAAAGIVLLLLVIAQVILPGIAADRLRTRLEAHGRVLSVGVSAFPAVELLWHQSDAVTVRMSTYRDASATARTAAIAGTGGGAVQRPAAPSGQGIAPAHRLANLLASTAHTGSLDAHVAVLQVGRLVLDNVALTKRGSVLTANVLLTQANLTAALPRLFTLRPLPSNPGQLAFRGTVHVLGTSVSMTAVLHAHNGAVVVSPQIAGFVPAFLALSVFSDPRIAVDSVSSRPVAGGWVISARARLTGT